MGMGNHNQSDEEPGWQEMGYPSEAEYLAYCAYEERERKRLTETRQPDGFAVSTHHGSEGPAHDPYSFTEITVTLPDGRELCYHGGLGEELSERRPGEREWRELHFGDGAEERFVKEVGFPIDQLEWWGDAPYRGIPCMACGREGCRGGCCE